MDAIQFQLVLEDKISGPAGKANGSLSRTEQALKKTDQSAKQAAGSADGMGSSLASLGAIAGATAAAVAVAAAAAVGLAAAFAKTVTASDAARTELIHTEALYRLARNYEGAEQAAKAYDSVVGATVRSTGVARASVNKLAEQLVKGGVGGQLFNDTLKRAAEASSVLGEEQASAYVQSVIGARAFGLSVDAVNDRMNKTLGGTAAKAAVSLDATMNRLRESFRDFAKGIKLEPLLDSFARLASLFDTTTWAGRGLQTLIGGLFGVFTDTVAGATPSMERFFKLLVIAGLKAYIAFQPAIKGIGKFFTGLMDIVGNQDVANAVIGALVLSFGALALVLGNIAGTLTAIAKVLGTLAATVRLVGAAFREQGIALGEMIGKGIGQGIEGSATEVAEKSRNMALMSREAVADELMIRSPSKVFAQLGMFSGQGYASGIEKAAPMVAQATTRAIAPPAPATTAAQATAAATAASASPARSGQTFAGSVTVNISGVDGARDLESRMPEIMASAFEAIGLTLGVGPASSLSPVGV